MPIYAYRCAECGHELDALQKLSEPALTDCPACGRAALAKKLTAAGFQLKGSGWYATDFRSGSKPQTKSDAPGEAKPGGASDSASGTTPDAKSDSKSESKSDSTATASASPAGGCGSGCACH